MMDRFARAILAVALLALSACSRPQATVADLRMPETHHPGIAAVTVRALALDSDDTQSPQAQKTAELLRGAGIVGSASYRYQVAPPGTGRYKVRIEMFVDAARAQANWQTRHLPEALAMTAPFAAGDEGWIYRDQMAGLRVGAVIVEIRAADGAVDLAAFARSYAEFVRETLARGGPGWWERLGWGSGG